MVIRVPELQIGETYAQVTASVRCLADDYGLRVIVDGSPNSIPPEVLTTKRASLMVVEAMSREEVESIPEFKSFIDILKEHNLDGPVWKVLGGSPQLYLKLKESIRKIISQSAPITASDEIVNQVKNDLESELLDALTLNIANSSTLTKQIIKIFRERNVVMIPKMELETLGLLLDYPNKVFREVKMKRDRYVVPVTTAVSLIISENVTDAKGLSALMEKIFKKPYEIG